MSLTKTIFRALLSLLTFGSLLHAEVSKEVKVESAYGIGEGYSRVEAVNNAIIEALSQLKGVSIAKEQIVARSVVEDEKGVQMQEGYSAKLHALTKGRVDSYVIEDVSEFDGKYKASVKITNTTVKKSYVAPGVSHDSRRKMAIYPFYGAKGSFDIFNEDKSIAEVSHKFSHALMTQMTQTRRFAMLDREYDAAIGNEKRLVASRNAHPDEALKLGNALGADYVLVGTISEFSVVPSKERIEVIGEERYKLFITAVIDYRVILMATGQVKWSNSVRYQNAFEDNPAESPEFVLSHVMNDVSRHLSYEIINTIYPLRVAEKMGNEVVINQGGAGILMGDVFEVMQEGKAIKDTYTKESLGNVEHKVGEVQVVRVDAKMAYAQIVQGEAPKNAVLRKLSLNQNAQSQSRGEAVSNVVVDGGGGIKLR